MPGTVVAPVWLMPIAALMCCSFPIMFLYLTGEYDRDKYERERMGVTLQQRALEPVTNSINWFKRIGQSDFDQPEHAPELGCAHAPLALQWGEVSTIDCSDRPSSSVPGSGATYPPSP